MSINDEEKVSETEKDQAPTGNTGTRDANRPNIEKASSIDTSRTTKAIHNDE